MCHRTPVINTAQLMAGFTMVVSAWLNGSSAGSIVYLYEKVRFGVATGAGGNCFDWSPGC